jgi:hypothetical protein
MKFEDFLIKAQAMVDANSSTQIHGADIQTFGSQFGLCPNWSSEFSDRMKQHYVTTWWCTDTWVGLSVYALDGKIVAVSTQTARKNRESIDFVSKEACEQVFDLVVAQVKSELAIDDQPFEIDDAWFDVKKATTQLRCHI